jgi:hypothetical protein
MRHSYRSLIFFIAAAFLGFACCAPIVATPTATIVSPASAPTLAPAPTQPLATATPSVANSTATPFREIVNSTPILATRAPTKSFDPAPADDKLLRANAFLDSIKLLAATSAPPQMSVQLTGSLPTPCHQLRVQVAQPNPQNQIRLAVYSVADPSAICAQMIAPFSVSVPLGNFVKGAYTVWVNDKQVGDFNSP